MKTGLVLGKFYPVHKGHVALIDFARERCDLLTILVCGSASENIPLETRLGWITDLYSHDSNIRPTAIRYDEAILPNTSVPSRRAAEAWAGEVYATCGDYDFVFSSEEYGEYFAEFLGAEHIAYDPNRSEVPVSATLIRESPFKYWDFLPPVVQPYFVKKVAIVGTESTGKSTLTERLGEHFETAFVMEMARAIIEKTIECTPAHLVQIAELHAKAIREAIKHANKLLFVDTDVNVTRSYSRFLFGNDLEVAEWIDEANRFDLHLYLENDAEFVQDGTRLERDSRDWLDFEHRKMFAERGIECVPVKGTWDEKFREAIDAVNERFDLPVAG
jgi:HTH-type transcriptional repressor of NAD biosynthesis genes